MTDATGRSLTDAEDLALDELLGAPPAVAARRPRSDEPIVPGR